MTRRYTKHEVDAAALTAVWAGLWAGAAAGAVGEGTGSVNAAARGRGVSPHALTAAHTTCPHVLPRSHSSNPVKMEVRLTKSGIQNGGQIKIKCSVLIQEITRHSIYPAITRQPDYWTRIRSPNQHWSPARINKTCQPQQNPS